MTFLTGSDLGEARARKARELLARETKQTSRKCILRRAILLQFMKNSMYAVFYALGFSSTDNRKYEPPESMRKHCKSTHVLFETREERVGQLFVCIRQTTCPFCRPIADKTPQTDPHLFFLDILLFLNRPYTHNQWKFPD